MSNEELYNSSSEVFDSISDSFTDSEADSITEDSSTAEQGSDESALTPVDTSSVVAVVVDNGEVIHELQRIEGVNISILYTLYIGLGIFLSVCIIKIIWYFARG